MDPTKFTVWGMYFDLSNNSSVFPEMWHLVHVKKPYYYYYYYVNTNISEDSRDLRPPISTASGVCGLFDWPKSLFFLLEVFPPWSSSPLRKKKRLLISLCLVWKSANYIKTFLRKRHLGLLCIISGVVSLISGCPALLTYMGKVATLRPDNAVPK